MNAAASFRSDCTALVVSCDAYADVVPPFLALWRRRWPDCPFETVLVTETVAPGAAADGARFDRVLLAGRCADWCVRISRVLGQIATPWVLLVLNDYYLAETVDTARILALLEAAKAADALNLRMNPKPPGTIPFAPGLAAFPKNTAYAVSCQTGFWNRSFLEGLLARNRSAWEFERRGSYQFDPSDVRPLLVTREKAFPFVDAVHKGYWEKTGVELLAEAGFEPDFVRRGLPPWRVRVLEALKSAVFNLNPELVTRIQNRFTAPSLGQR